MRCYCNYCNNFFEADVLTECPHCFSVGDELEECDDLCEEIEDNAYEPTEADLEAMYMDYEATRDVCNRYAIIGAQ